MDPGGAGLPPVGDINDYGKFGLWHDCLYMAANAFTSEQAPTMAWSFASFSRSDLYSGAPLTFSIGYLPPSTNAFTLIPSNNQGKGANAVAAGNAELFRFRIGSRRGIRGPQVHVPARTAAPAVRSARRRSSARLSTRSSRARSFRSRTRRRKLDMIDDRLMQKVQYRKIGGTESLWVTHSGREQPQVTTAMQWAQLDVTGGTDRDDAGAAADLCARHTLYRFMGSLAVDEQGNMALGYSTSNGTVAEFSEHRLFRQARDRSVEYAAADRSAA